ncbi:hypothetical protein JB92DRAFT_103742 [Gautieria morchelliformis]|nr:hypothetical protein JB92DRAFT_103742 [Gautieria morchelliformis]
MATERQDVTSCLQTSVAPLQVWKVPARPLLDVKIVRDMHLLQIMISHLPETGTDHHHRPSVHTRLGDAPRRKRQPLPPQSERFKEVAAGPPAPTLPPPRHVTNGPLPSVTPSGPRRLPPREVNPIDSVQQGSVRAISQRKDFEDIRGQVGNSSQTRAFETNVGFAEGKHYEERGRPRQWDRERERAFPAELPTGPRAMDLDAEPPVFARRGRSPMRQHRDAYEDASPPPHLPTSGPRHSDRREHFASGGLKHSFTATDRAHREQQGRSRLAENQEFSHSQPARPDSLPSQTRFQQPQPSRLAFSSKPSSTNQLPAATNKLGTAGQSIEASSKRHGGEYPLRGPSPPQSTNDPSLHAREHGGRRSRSPKAVGLSVDTDRNDLRHERSLVTRGDDAELRSEAKGIIEAQPRGQSRFSDMDPERSNTLLNTSRPSSPPGARAIRIRRPSKLPDSTSSIEHRPPAGRGQPQPNRPHRQGSLLDRLSNPSVPGVTPPLRDRVSSPGENWKRGGTGPQSGPGTSLRDRLEGVGDARHARNIEWDQPFEDPTNGSNRRDRQNRRGGLGRGGRGQ